MCACPLQAIRVMKSQKAGHILNMDGAGADGSPTPRFAAYGATKRSLAHLGASLSAELSQARKPGCHVVWGRGR
jgi:chlorophyll(ide) b reductase